MAAVIAEFFGLVGVDQAPPATMAELIPWMFTLIIGLCLVSGVFGVIGKLIVLFLDRRRF